MNPSGGVAHRPALLGRRRFLAATGGLGAGLLLAGCSTTTSAGSAHVFAQLDRGHSGALIVDDPAEPGGYDHELVVVFDDWLDGTGRTPDQELAELKANGMGAMRLPHPFVPSPATGSA